MRHALGLSLILLAVLTGTGLAVLGGTVLSWLQGGLVLGGWELPLCWVVGLGLSGLGLLVGLGPGLASLQRARSFFAGRGSLGMRADGLALAGFVAAVLLPVALGLARGGLLVHAPPPADVHDRASQARDRGQDEELGALGEGQAEILARLDALSWDDPVRWRSCQEDRERVIAARLRLAQALLGVPLTCEPSSRSRFEGIGLTLDPESVCTDHGPMRGEFSDVHGTCEVEGSREAQVLWAAMGGRLATLVPSLQATELTITGRADQRPVARCPAPAGEGGAALQIDNQGLAQRRVDEVYRHLVLGQPTDWAWTTRLLRRTEVMEEGCAEEDDACLSRQRRVQLSVEGGPALNLDPRCAQP